MCRVMKQKYFSCRNILFKSVEYAYKIDPNRNIK